jgi:hypothetical protein
MIEPKKDGTKLERRIFEEFEDVRVLLGKFKAPDGSSTMQLSRDFNKIWDTTKTRYKPAPTIAIPQNIGMYDPDLGTIEVRYASTPPTKTKSGISWGRESKFMLREGMSISDKQIDLAWFILKASKVVENGILKVVDKQAEYEGSFKDMARQADVVAAIFDKNLTLETILEIAALVPTESPVGGASREEVAMKLWTIVESGEKNKKVYNFDSALKAIAKVKKANGAAATDGKEVVEVGLVNGEVLSIARLKCPVTYSMEQMIKKANELNFPTEGLDKDLLYSVIKHKLAEAGQK